MVNKNLEHKIIAIVKKAKKASMALALVESSAKDRALEAMGNALLARSAYIIAENKKDLLLAAKSKLSKAMVDRLTLDGKRIEAMAKSLFEMVKLSDPVGEVLKVMERPNGLVIKKVRTPIGVIGIIYESRPNVTSDCIGLCLKSSNAVILKGGKEAVYSNKAIFSVMREALRQTSLPSDAVQLVTDTDRRAVNVLLKQDQYIDVIIPRGGESLIEFVTEHSRIPVIKHYKGICHIYVSEHANLEMADQICFNAKVQRPGVCNAMETMLVDSAVAEQFLPKMAKRFQEAGVELRGCARTRKIIKSKIKAATEKDFRTEYLDLILSVRVVDGVHEAIDHINDFGSHHSDAIVTEDQEEAEAFLKAVDSSGVFVNASTRFTDGFEFGFGAEIGISTDKLHARGPMALEELTTYKYVIYGQGQVRV